MLLLAVGSLLVAAQGAGAAVEGNVWISLDSSSSPLTAPSGAYSYSPSVSADGNYVAFQTLASVARDGDSNGMADVFRRDIAQSLTALVSVTSDGSQSNNRSYAPDITADGATVVFESLASNLVQGDANNAPDIYVRDLTAATTTRISIGAGGSDTNGASFRPAISADGAYIAFCSRATNLVPDDAGGGTARAFLYTRANGSVTKIPIDSGAGATAGCTRVAIDDDGGVVAVSAVTGGVSNVFAYDSASATTTPLTATADDSSGLSGLAISGDGRVVAFDSIATNLVADDSNRSRDVFVENVSDKTVTRASVRTSGSQLAADSGMSGVSLSGDGRFVVFGSAANEVVPGDSNKREDVFRRDLVNGQTAIVSLNVNDRPANDSSFAPDVDADGSVVAYASLAANVLAGDTNRQSDVFVRGTNFPDRDGDSAPEDTGAPKDDAGLISAPNDDGGARLAYISGGIAAAVLVLIAGWFLLGRRGRA